MTEQRTGSAPQDPNKPTPGAAFQVAKDQIGQGDLEDAYGTLGRITHEFPVSPEASGAKVIRAWIACAKMVAKRWLAHVYVEPQTAGVFTAGEDYPDPYDRSLDDMLVWAERLSEDASALLGAGEHFFGKNAAWFQAHPLLVVGEAEHFFGVVFPLEGEHFPIKWPLHDVDRKVFFHQPARWCHRCQVLLDDASKMTRQFADDDRPALERRETLLCALLVGHQVVGYRHTVSSTEEHAAAIFGVVHWPIFYMWIGSWLGEAASYADTLSLEDPALELQAPPDRCKRTAERAARIALLCLERAVALADEELKPSASALLRESTDVLRQIAQGGSGDAGGPTL